MIKINNHFIIFSQQLRTNEIIDPTYLLFRYAKVRGRSGSQVQAEFKDNLQNPKGRSELQEDSLEHVGQGKADL